MRPQRRARSHALLIASAVLALVTGTIGIRPSAAGIRGDLPVAGGIAAVVWDGAPGSSLAGDSEAAGCSLDSAWVTDASGAFVDYAAPEASAGASETASPALSSDSAGTPVLVSCAPADATAPPVPDVTPRATPAIVASPSATATVATPAPGVESAQAPVSPTPASDAFPQSASTPAATVVPPQASVAATPLVSERYWFPNGGETWYCLNMLGQAAGASCRRTINEQYAADQATKDYTKSVRDCWNEATVGRPVPDCWQR